MKKVLKSCFALILGCMCMFNLGKEVKANELVVSAPDDIGMTYHSNGHDSTIGRIYVDGKLVFCIEPYKQILTGQVVIPGGSLSQQKQNEISLISHFGYTATRNSDKWYAATQMLIWEALGYEGSVTEFSDYQTYKETIQNDIKHYLTKPSFDNSNIVLKANESKTLTDTNNVISEFKNKTYDSSLIDLSVSGNKLTIKSKTNKSTSATISLKKKNNSELAVPIIYTSVDGSVQQTIETKLNTNVESKLSFKIQSIGKLSFFKEGEVLTNTTTYDSEFGKVYNLVLENKRLSNVKANIYANEDIKDIEGNLIYTKDQLVDELVSDENGVTSKELITGNYYLKEIETLDSYVIDNNKYEFSIGNNSTEIEIKDKTLLNVRSDITLNVRKENEKHPFMNLNDAYKDVVYGIYNVNDILDYKGNVLIPKNNLVYISNIDVAGNLIEDTDLMLGDYYLKELACNENYVLDQTNYYFSVKGNNQPLISIDINEGVIKNNLKRSKLKICKIDADTQKPLVASFVLYNKEMDIVDEFDTDKNGEYEISNLVNGEYFIQEVKAPEGYNINSKLVKIKIDGKDVSYTLKNKKHSITRASIETNDPLNARKNLIGIAGSMGVFYILLIKRLVRN